MCSGSIVITTWNLEGSNPEWMPILYEARSTAQGLPEPSSTRCSALGNSLCVNQSCPRVGWTRGSGRVGSRFCRILAGRVGSALRIFLVFY